MKRVFLYPYARPGGRNYFNQIGTTQDVMAGGAPFSHAAANFILAFEHVTPQLPHGTL